MPCTYVIFSKSRDKFYVGSTRRNSPAVRVSAHNQGKTRSTKSGIPWQLVYYEKFSDYTSARKKEFFFKSGVGRKKIRQEYSGLL